VVVARGVTRRDFKDILPFLTAKASVKIRLSLTSSRPEIDPEHFLSQEPELCFVLPSVSSSKEQMQVRFPTLTLMSSNESCAIAT